MAAEVPPELTAAMAELRRAGQAPGAYRAHATAAARRKLAEVCERLGLEPAGAEALAGRDGTPIH